VMQVADTGIGIPEKAREYIFDPFRQVDESFTREYGGIGLGLAIVRQLAMLMGGEVALESEVGHGSTFTVTLPLEPVKEGKNV
jgi:signal transduction histidine kinase